MVDSFASSFAFEHDAMMMMPHLIRPRDNTATTKLEIDERFSTRKRKENSNQMNLFHDEVDKILLKHILEDLLRRDNRQWD